MSQAVHVQKLLARAQAVLAQVAPQHHQDDVEKRIIRSPAGKRNVVKWLLPLIPPHRCYVEPFAGSAALFFAKEPAPEEVLNDRDPEIAFAYRFVQRMAPDTLDELKRLYWKNSRPYFEKLKDKKPTNDLERFHKFIYLNRFSYFSKPGRFASYNPGEDGTVFRQFDKFIKGKERLEKTIIRTGDYEKVIREFDGPQTFFFLDPPFPGYDQSVGESEFDEERFVKVLHDIQGKFLLTYGLKSDRALFDKFQVRRIMVPTATPAGLDRRPLLFIANYDIRKRKRARWTRGQNAAAARGDSPVTPAPSPSPPDQAARPDPTQDQEMAPFYTRVVDLAQPIIKRGSEEERFTLGVVLEPDVVDAQNDQYSKEEVRRACHRFAEFYLNAGLMHRELANGRIVILENYLAPCDFMAENGEPVKEGTWLQGRGYRDDEIWQKIKNGELTGLSIGGSAIRKPIENAKGIENTSESQPMT
jgi:DNA adenine methylase